LVGLRVPFSGWNVPGPDLSVRAEPSAGGDVQGTLTRPTTTAPLEAPPELMTGRSGAAPAAAFYSTDVRLVGTPQTMVVSSAARESMMLCGSQRGKRVTGAPALLAGRVTAARPNAWKSGRPVADRSAGVASIISRTISVAEMKFPKVSIVPFGLPVVPEV